MKTRYVFLFCFFVLSVLVPADSYCQDEDLFPGGRYDENIPTPLEIIGHRFGHVHMFHWEMEKYILEIDRVSDRVKVFNYGKSYEGRDLYYILSNGNCKRGLTAKALTCKSTHLY